jgi:hypothetical protein
VERARATHHLHDAERRVVASWLVAMAPAHVSSGPEGVAALTLAGLAVESRGQLQGDHYEALASWVRTFRDKRAAHGEAQFKSTGCKKIIETTLAAAPASSSTNSVQCPFAAAQQGQVLACQRACRQQLGPGAPMVFHPLDGLAAHALNDW